MPPFVPGLDAAKTHTFVIAFMNELSTGSVTLRSANPSDSPVIDPQFFSHPFDRRVAIETMKEALTFLDTLKSEYIVGPEGTDDEAIWVSSSLAPVHFLTSYGAVVGLARQTFPVALMRFPA